MFPPPAPMAAAQGMRYAFYNADSPGFVPLAKGRTLTVDTAGNKR